LIRQAMTLKEAYAMPPSRPITRCHAAAVVTMNKVQKYAWAWGTASRRRFSYRLCFLWCWRRGWVFQKVGDQELGISCYVGSKRCMANPVLRWILLGSWTRQNSYFLNCEKPFLGVDCQLCLHYNRNFPHDGRARPRFAVTLQQREKLAALGTLAAGQHTELNNPSAAVNRSARTWSKRFFKNGRLYRCWISS